jgi:hypothetical protein
MIRARCSRSSGHDLSSTITVVAVDCLPKRLVMVRLTLLAGLEFSVTPSVTPASSSYCLFLSKLRPRVPKRDYGRENALDKGRP